MVRKICKPLKSRVFLVGFVVTLKVSAAAIAMFANPSQKSRDFNGLWILSTAIDISALIMSSQKFDRSFPGLKHDEKIGVEVLAILAAHEFEHLCIIQIVTDDYLHNVQLLVWECGFQTESAPDQRPPWRHALGCVFGH